LVEELETAPPPRPSATGVADGRSPVAITEIVEISAKDRRTTGIGELDRVLGGGMVAGCLVLLGGDPGIGKSTLLVQALAGWRRAAACCTPPARSRWRRPRCGRGGSAQRLAR